MRTASRLKIFLICGFLLFGAAWYLRLEPYRPFSDIRGVFFANYFHATIYTIENGHFYHQGDLRIESTVGRNVYSATSDRLSVFFTSILVIILQENPDTESAAWVLTKIPWQGLFLFPAAVLLTTSIPGYETGDRRKVFLLALLYTFFGTYSLIYLTHGGLHSAATGWAPMLIAIWTVYKLNSGETRFRYVFILLAMTLTVLGFYHTAATVFLISFTSLMAICYLFGYVSRRQTSIVASVAVLYISYMMYAGETFFTGYVSGVARIVFAVQHGFNPATGASEAYAEAMAITPPLAIRIASISAQAIVSLLIIISGLLMLYKNRDKIPFDVAAIDFREALPFLYLASLIPVGAALFLRYGIGTLVNRLFEYTMIIVPLVLAVVYANANQLPALNQQRVFSGLMAILLISAGASTYAYMETPTRDSGVLEHSEYASVTHTLEYKTSEDSPVFTDYRISSAFLSNDHLEISAVWPGAANRTDRQMRDIYYTTDPATQSSAIRELRVGSESPDYVVISEKQQDSNVGVSVGGRVFRNMTRSEYEDFNRDPGLNKVYDSDAGVYRLDEQ